MSGMSIKRINLKVSEATHAEWLEKSEREGLSLTKTLVKAMGLLGSGLTLNPVPLAVAKAEVMRQKEFRGKPMADDSRKVVAVPPQSVPDIRQVPDIPGVAKASDWKPPMPSLKKYEPGPCPKVKK